MNIKKEQYLSPQSAMQLAVKTAKKGIGRVEPNPPVACVILDKKYKLLSVGWHKAYGADHAEISALKKIKDKKKLKDAHVFVTLEPCHHHGKTAPCSQALAAQPIASLTYGAKDPLTSQKGLNFLKRKGIKIFQSPFYSQELKELIEPFVFANTHKKPFVSLKLASSLDGNIALKQGNSQWITGEKARRHTHLLRARHSAVLAGLNTLLTDNPRLNIRLKPFKNKKNKAVILDPLGKSLAFLLKSRLLKTHSSKDIIICCSQTMKHKLQAGRRIGKASAIQNFKIKFFKTLKQTKQQKRCSTLTKNHQVLDLNEILKHLYQEENIQSLLVEGGAFTISEFLKQKAAQKIFLYTAPFILGEGLKWSGGLAIPDWNHRVSLTAVKQQKLHKDFLLSGSLNFPAESGLIS